MAKKEKETLQEIIEVSDVIRKKYNALKRGHADNQQLLIDTFKPITDPLKELVQQNVSESDEDMSTVKKYKKKNKKARMRNRKIKALSEEGVSPATPSSSQNILLTPRKLNFEPQTPFLDLSVIAEKEEEHSPRSLIKSVLETPEGQKQLIELKEKYSDEFGHIAADYLLYFVTADSSELDTTYGIRKDDEGNFKIGDKTVSIVHNDIVVGDKFYLGTKGLYELLFKKNPKSYTDRDTANYIEIIKDSNVHKRKYSATEQLKGNRSHKWVHILKPALPVTRRRSQSASSVLGHGVVKNDVMNVTALKREYIYWNDINELVDRLRLLLASTHAGHTAHNNEIVSIIEELREANIIE